MRIGAPKGRLLARSQDALSVAPPEASTWLLRLQDIPGLVANDVLDAGISSDEWIRETRSDVVRLAPLCWYHVRICTIASPTDRHQGRPVHIVSEYPSIAQDFANLRHPDARVRKVHGATESYVPGLADLAVDCVETGDSLRRAGLVVDEELFRADVWVVASRRAVADPPTYAALTAWARDIGTGRPACAWSAMEPAHA